MKKFLYGGLFVAVILFSCTQNPKPAAVEKVAVKAQKDSVVLTNPNIGQPIVSSAAALANFSAFWLYYNQHIELFSNFTPLNTKGEVISKKSFLTQMGTGRYFPLALHAADQVPVYRLEKIGPKAHENIGAYMKMFSGHELKYHELKGKPVPAFRFTAVDGKVYTSENTKGKIVLFKCWFIGCVACVAEMPALNQMVEQYKDRKDILFISLASDSKAKLQQFFTKVKFDYTTIPLQNDYMVKKLNVTVYPTHFLINKEGILVQVLPDERQIAKALAQLLEKEG